MHLPLTKGAFLYLLIVLAEGPLHQHYRHILQAQKGAASMNGWWPCACHQSTQSLAEEVHWQWRWIVHRGRSNESFQGRNWGHIWGGRGGSGAVVHIRSYTLFFSLPFPLVLLGLMPAVQMTQSKKRARAVTDTGKAAAATLLVQVWEDSLAVKGLVEG